VLRGVYLLENGDGNLPLSTIMGTTVHDQTLSSSSKIAATQSKEALIKAALINFIAVNNRLPCPAIRLQQQVRLEHINDAPSTFGAGTVNAATLRVAECR